MTQRSFFPIKGGGQVLGGNFTFLNPLLGWEWNSCLGDKFQRYNCLWGSLSSGRREEGVYCSEGVLAGTATCLVIIVFGSAGNLSLLSSSNYAAERSHKMIYTVKASLSF